MRSSRIYRLQAAQALLILVAAMIVGCPLGWVCVRCFR